ncbi:tetrapyrrole biosynthesis, uroporphyrinogen III synthase [Armillaria borealis]|uniref:Tetrapyrrole biosynthesis, uroporphyrinogen III synthase n=1 Tax=Armillaria borealis TaxID=47425 RepID=A0AA39JG16_9AGAR|nr:tetrapyrrole biosynthesis, uroporphyrinogen III synthase [Armillaria borealis]
MVDGQGHSGRGPGRSLLRPFNVNTYQHLFPPFATENYTPFSVPVLETVLTNIAELASVTGQSDFDGVIMTSARSCEAWDKANGTGKDEFPFYLVGMATASTLRSSMANADIRGESSGTAEQLANLNRDTLPNILGSAGVFLHSLKVYETQGSSTFSQQLKGIVPSETDYAMIAIGPTTATFLRETLGLRVDAIPTKPSAEELLRAIVDVDATS